MALDGTLAYPTATFAPGRSLEFAATFSGAPYQHAGLGMTFTEGLWAIFSSGPGDGLYVRSNNGSVSTDTPIPGSWFGSSHKFRIDWTATGITYSIDGAQVAFHTQAMTANMRPIGSDYGHDGSVLSIDWMRLTPYAPTTTFTSGVVDAGDTVTWTTAALSSSAPAGTAVVFNVRYGNTAIPDASWTAFAPVVGGTLNTSSRYLQYQFVLSSTDPNQTPIVSDVTFNLVR
jgi:hypothetical protein